MNTTNKYVTNVMMTFVLLSVVGCSSMSARDKNIAIGAGVGGVADRW